MPKASPVPNALTRPFWDACARGQLLYQVCTACARPQFYPRDHCAHCQSKTLEWKQSGRLGAVFACTTVQRAPTTAFKEMVPYVIALVDLDEGFRMMLNVLDCPPEAVRIGSRVEVVFRPADNGIAMPQSRLVA